MMQRTPKFFITLILSFTLCGPLSAEEKSEEKTAPVETTAETPLQDGEEKAQESQEEEAKKSDETEQSGDDAASGNATATETNDTETAATEEKTAEPTPSAQPQEETTESVAQQAVAKELDEPTKAESRTIAWVFAGLTVASAAGGVYAGLQAQEQFDCLSNVISCNEDRDTPIENEDFLKAKSDLDRITLLADMGFLTAVVTSTVTIAAIVKAMSDDTPTEQDQRTSMLSALQE